MARFPHREIAQRLADGDAARTTEEKGAALEDVVVRSFCLAKGVSLLYRDQTNTPGSAEIDILLFNERQRLGFSFLPEYRNGLRRVSPPVRRGRPRLDIIGMLLLAGAISVLLLALGWGGTVYPWGSYQIFGLAGFGTCLLLLLVLQELRAHDPLLPPRVFMSSSYIAYVIVSTLTSLLLFMCLFTIPLYFQYVRGATAALSGIYVAPFVLASAFGMSPAAGGPATSAPCGEACESPAL